MDVGTTGPAPGLGVGGHERGGLQAEVVPVRPNQVGEEAGMVHVIGLGEAEDRGRREPYVHRDAGMPLGGTDDRLHLVQRGPVGPEATIWPERWGTVHGEGDADQQRAMCRRFALRDDGQVDQWRGQAVQGRAPGSQERHGERVDAAGSGTEATFGTHLKHQ